MASGRHFFSLLGIGP